MTDKQPEALRLADLIRSRYGNDINDEAADELRRLHTVNSELLEALKAVHPYIATQAVGCHGYKCREPWCWSCNGEVDAEIAAGKGLDAFVKAQAAISKFDNKS